MNDNPTPPKSSKPKAFDVTPPGQTPPDSSSRPVIITNQPEQSDPMLREDEQTSNPDSVSDPSTAATEPSEHSDEHPSVSPSIKKELTVLEKDHLDIDSNLVTVSSEPAVTKNTWQKPLIISGVVIILIALIYYYR